MQNFDGGKHRVLEMLRTMQLDMKNYRLVMPAGIILPDTKYEIWINGQQDMVEFLTLKDLDKRWIYLATR